MTRNRADGLLAILSLTGLLVACSSSAGRSTSRTNGDANQDVSAPTRAAEDCPKTIISVNETKVGGLKKYDGCLLSVKGKIWEVRGSDGIALIDASERNDYNGALFIGGNFSGSTYYEIGRKISELKISGDLDKLPVAVFTGTVETANGNTSLKNSVVTEVQKQ